MICQSCGGRIGLDCFNPVECAAIGEAQERDRQRAEHYEQIPLAMTQEQRIAELERRLAELEAKLEIGGTA